MSEKRCTEHRIEDHLEVFSEQEDFGTVSDIFKMLGDATRVRLFWLLCHCESCVCNLGETMGMSSPAVSHHLKLLKTAGLVVTRREGKEVIYKAAETQQARALHWIIEKVIQITCPVA